MPDRKPVLVDGSRNITAGRDLHLHDIALIPIPAHLSRPCPQCGCPTWALSRHCRVCDFDLFEYDRWRPLCVVASMAGAILAGGVTYFATSAYLASIAASAFVGMSLLVAVPHWRRRGRTAGTKGQTGFRKNDEGQTSSALTTQADDD